MAHKLVRRYAVTDAAKHDARAHRSMQCKVPRAQEDTKQLTADMIELARQYGRCS